MDQFVADRLLRMPSPEILQSLVERIGLRLEQIEEPLGEAVEIRPLRAAVPTRPVFAVDGSSYMVQDGRAFVIGGFRAGAIGFRFEPDPAGHSRITRIASLATPTYLELLDHASLMQVWNRHFREVTGQEAQSLPFPDSHRVLFEDVLSQLRSLREWGVFGSLILTAPEGSILLLDGSLRGSEHAVGVEISDSLLRAARERNMILVGVVKDSTRREGEVPVHLKVIASARRMGVEGPWWTRLERENAWFVQFTERKGWVFRCEMILPPGVEGEAVLAELASFAYAPPTVGYPLPLVKVDQEIAFTKEEASRLVKLIRRYAFDAGLSLADVDRLFKIQHHIVDKMRLRSV